MIYREKSAHMMSLAEYLTMIILKYDKRCSKGIDALQVFLQDMEFLMVLFNSYIYSLLTVVRLM